MVKRKDSDSSTQLPNPKRLKTLASLVTYTVGNNLLHQFVLANSSPNHSGSENYINAVLLSMSGTDSVNVLNAEGYSALHLAVLKNNCLMVKKLLSCLVNIDVNIIGGDRGKNAALHLAAEMGQLSIIEELLNKGADVDRKTGYGHTALCSAAKSGYLDIIKLLVSKGANVNLRGTWGVPLHYATEFGNLAAVEFLVRNGADVNARDKESGTPLHDAVYMGNLEIVEFLVANGSNVNAVDGVERTPLHAATYMAYFEIVKFLVGKGADLEAIDELWHTPFDQACCRGNGEIVEFLYNKGARTCKARVKYHRGKKMYLPAPLYFLT